MTISKEADILVIGGGLAGLVSAIDLAQRKYSVILLEKKSYPRHKVCGEYISNEVKPYLKRLGIYPEQLSPKNINRFQLTAVDGSQAECAMEMGGFGISRYALDNFLFQKAKQAGVEVVQHCTATAAVFQKERFRVETNGKGTFGARVVIGAQGKRSLLDKQLNRKFFQEKTSYVGVKRHFQADFPDDLVSLHNFDGGYLGLSKVESDAVNCCYLTTTHVFQSYASIEELELKHLSQNPVLKDFYARARPVFAKPLVISQINFSPKPAVENHILMCGDAAGMIHPLCGNGMAMAINGARLCAQLLSEFLQGQISRIEMEQKYQKHWRQAFAQRLSFGRHAQGLFGRNSLSNFAVRLGAAFPGLLKKTVRFSHGSEVL